MFLTPRFTLHISPLFIYCISDTLLVTPLPPVHCLLVSLSLLTCPIVTTMYWNNIPLMYIENQCILLHSPPLTTYRPWLKHITPHPGLTQRLAVGQPILNPCHHTQCPCYSLPFYGHVTRAISIIYLFRCQCCLLQMGLGFGVIWTGSHVCMQFTLHRQRH